MYLHTILSVPTTIAIILTTILLFSIESTNVLKRSRLYFYIAYMKNNVRTVILLTLACENNNSKFLKSFENNEYFG